MSTFRENIRDRLRDPLYYIVSAVTLTIAVVNISTRLSDAEAFGAILPWQDPVVAELSSALALIILLPFVFAFFDALPLSRNTSLRRASLYLLASMVFSLFHVGIMVALRMVTWPLILEGSYDFFADGVGALLYEYQKDGISFLLYWLVWEFQRRIHQAREQSVAEEPLYLKSGATTIVLKASEFLHAKAAGNYGDVTSKAGTQLVRITLKELEAALQDKGCGAVRIHRSMIVNQAEIIETTPIAGGDLSVKLRGGEILRASRRYKDALNAD